MSHRDRLPSSASPSAAHAGAAALASSAAPGAAAGSSGSSGSSQRQRARRIPDDIEPRQDPPLLTLSYFPPPTSNSVPASTPVSGSASSKIPISRLVPDNEGPAAGSASGRDAMEKQRVRHACESCRSRKTKCSGERPTCAHCVEHNLHCFYGDGKRDRVKRELDSLQERIGTYERLFEQLSLRGDSATQLAIQQLPAAGGSQASASASSRGPWRAHSDDDDSSEVEEGGVAAEEGSTGSLDAITNEHSATGSYFGKNSPISWLYHAMRSLDKTVGSATESATVVPPSSWSPSNVPGWQMEDVITKGSRKLPYELDDIPLPPPTHWDRRSLPPKTLADALVNAYFATTHSSFPIILGSRFLHAIEQCYLDARPPTRRWLALLNLIFAISARYFTLTQVGWCHDNAHEVFFSHARALELDECSYATVVDIEQVQIIALATLYLIAADHLNKAWTIGGIAIRSAQSLGLHLRQLSDVFTDVEKEHRTRLWWSIYRLDLLLQCMTGRPSAIEHANVSATLPIAVPESAFPAEGGPLFEPASPGEQSPAETLSPATGSSSASRPLVGAPSSATAPSRGSGHFPASRALQTATSSPASAWGSASHGTEPGSAHAASPAARARASRQALHLQAHSSPRMPLETNSATMLIILVRLSIIQHLNVKSLYPASASKRSWLKHQKRVEEAQLKLARWRSQLPTAFDFGSIHNDPTFARERLALALHYWSAMMVATRPCLCLIDSLMPDAPEQTARRHQDSAIACIEAASELIDLLPHDPNPVGFYAVAPWWSLLHHLMQAAAVLVMELSLKCRHVPAKTPKFVAESKKAVRWLWAMGRQSTAAARAWKSMDDLVRRGVGLVGGDTSDMLDIEPAPIMGNVMPSCPPTEFQQPLGASAPYAHPGLAPAIPPQQAMMLYSQQAPLDQGHVFPAFGFIFNTSQQMEDLLLDQSGGPSQYQQGH